MSTSFMENLRHRELFEELTRGFQMDKGSCIDTVDWFIENGHRSNSLRNGFSDAMEVAIKIKDYANECAEATRTWIEV
jgi:hypothetical protein